MTRAIAGALIGVVCTIIFYFIPGINVIAPLLGGFLAGYYADGGFRGGLLTGVLMTILMIIPGILLGGVLASILKNAPVLSGFVVASTFVITLVIVAHSAVVGIIGSVLGAILEENRAT